MAQPTARHEGDPGGGGADGRLADSPSGGSIRSASVRAGTLGPPGCGPPNDAEETTRAEEILDGGVSRGRRGLRDPHQPPTSVHPPRPPPPPPPTQKLSGFTKWDPNAPLLLLLFIFDPSPDCCSRVSSGSQRGAGRSARPTPKCCDRSSRSSGRTNPLQCCGREAQLLAGTLVQRLVDLDTHHHHHPHHQHKHTHTHKQVPSKHVKEVEF